MTQIKIGGTLGETDVLGNGNGASIAIDGSNFLYVCGMSGSVNYPLQNLGSPAFWQPVKAGTEDCTITRISLNNLGSPLGVRNLKGIVSLGFYPNPTNKYLVVDQAKWSNQSLHYSIYNLLGEQLMECTLNTVENKTIDVSSLCNGIYILNIGTATETFSNKFIKTED